MREQVWFLISKTDERRFATTRPPSGEWVEALKKEGYKIFRLEFDMPEGWDGETEEVLQGEIKKPQRYRSRSFEACSDCVRCGRPYVEHLVPGHYNLECPL